MRLLMLSSDFKIFEEGSAVLRRMERYGTLVEELLIVVVGPGTHKEMRIAPNVRAVAPGGKGKLSSFLSARKALRVLTEDTKYDLVSAQDPFFIGLLGYGIARKRGIPLQAQLHTDCFSLGFLTESPRRIVEALTAIFILNQAQCIRVVSERIARSVHTLTRVPVTVLPIRVESQQGDSRERANPSGNLKFLSVSRLTVEKRVHLIVDAIAEISGAELTVVGDGPLKKSLDFRVQRLGLGERVRFVGWQDPSKYYKEADAFVQASRYEGYGVTLMEAALEGLPIITTDVGIVGETLEHGESALVVKGESRAIARAMKRLADEPELRIRLSVRAKESAHRDAVSSEEEYLLRYQRALRGCTT